MSTRSDQRKDAAEHGLYDPAYEHDACGVGFVASVKGQARHEIVTQALQILKNLDHRRRGRCRSAGAVTVPVF